MISVIVPVYDAENYICRCIDSILNQTYKDYEIILVDDGSPDESGAICDEYASLHNNITVIHHKENGGRSAARNTGLDNVKGQYITFLDSDDFFHPQALEILMNCLEEKNADICICDYQIIREDVSDFSEITEYNLVEYTPKEAIRGFIEADKRCEFVTTCIKAYKKEIFDNIRFPLGKVHEDNFTTWKCYFNANSIVRCDAKLYYYFRNVNGIMNERYSPKKLVTIDAAEELMCALKGYDKELWMRAVDYYIVTMSCSYRAVKDWLKDEEICKQIQLRLRKTLRKNKTYKKFNLTNFYDAYLIARPIRAELQFKWQALIKRIR